MRSGVKSEQGATLAEVRAIGEKVNSVTRTMGIALTACTPPAKGSPLFDLGDDETAVGVGLAVPKTRKIALAGLVGYLLYLGANVVRNR